METIIKRVIRCIGFGLYALIVLAFLGWPWKSDQALIEENEQWLQEHPGTFNWRVHNELRHLYSDIRPPNMRKAMEHADIILQHSPMDNYTLQTLSDWYIDSNPDIARTILLKQAHAFPDLRFLAAACFLKIGELYAAEGKHEEANVFYRKIVEDTSLPSQYRSRAEGKMKRAKRPDGAA